MASMWVLQIASLVVVATGVTTTIAAVKTTTTTTKIITVSTDIVFTCGGTVVEKDFAGPKYSVMLKTAIAAAAGNSLLPAHIELAKTAVKTTTVKGAVTTVKGAVTTVKGAVTTVKGAVTTVKGAVTTVKGAVTTTTKAAAVTTTTKAAAVTTTTKAAAVTTTTKAVTTTTTAAAGRRLAFVVKVTATITVTAATQKAVKASVDAAAFATALKTQLPIAAKTQGLDVKIGAITAVSATKGVIVGGANTTAAGASGANRAMALSGAALLIFAASQ